MIKIKNFTPVKLRLLLFISFGLILLLGSGIFYLAYGNLGKVANETGEKVASARDSQNTLKRLQALKSELEAKKDIIDKAAHVAANSQNYSYQDQIINDLTVYASRANLEISNITFTAGAAASSTPTAPATPAAGTTGTAGASPAPTGLKTAAVSVTLKNPVDYKNMLNFLHYIEQNLTKLKVSSVTLSHGDGGEVSTDTLNIEVYVR